LLYLAQFLARCVVVLRLIKIDETGKQTWPAGLRVNYPSNNHANGYSQHWRSPITRFPQFGKDQKDEAQQDCGALKNREDWGNGVTTQEGLCIFISSSNHVNKPYKVTYSYNTNYHGDSDVLYTGRENVKVNDAPGSIVRVTSAEMHRFWDKNVDGQAPKLYGVWDVHTCSKRGVCDHATGECKCFAGYGGVACSSQKTISYQTA